MVPEHPTKIVYFQACKLPMVLVEKLIVLENYFMAWTKVRSDEVNEELVPSYFKLFPSWLLLPSGRGKVFFFTVVILLVQGFGVYWFNPN